MICYKLMIYIVLINMSSALSSYAIFLNPLTKTYNLGDSAFTAALWPYKDVNLI